MQRLACAPHSIERINNGVFETSHLWFSIWELGFPGWKTQKRTERFQQLARNRYHERNQTAKQATNAAEKTAVVADAVKSLKKQAARESEGTGWFSRRPRRPLIRIVRIARSGEIASERQIFEKNCTLPLPFSPMAVENHPGMRESFKEDRAKRDRAARPRNRHLFERHVRYFRP